MERKILVVDDEEVTRRLLKQLLENHSYTVISSDNGSQALILARESRPDLILLDAQLPGLDGHTLCRVLKRDKATRMFPIIMMSGARIQEKDILLGYEGGADDYILKPFSLPVLIAKIQAVLRLYEASPPANDTVKKGTIELDPLGRSVKVNDKNVPLTRKEFDLLSILISKTGCVLSIPYLLETVWGYDPADYNDPGTVEVHVSHLRKKLGVRLGKKIVSVTGHGYKFEE